jgi:uncharacterized iron-regulated membrane protein
MNSATDRRLSAQQLYARIWRWHFFAALLVIPFVLWQAVTGTMYLWHEELADAIYPQLRLVVPQAARVAYEDQLATALAHHADESLAFMDVYEDPRRATMFSFTAGNGLPHPAFVDPYTGRYLGSISPTHWLPGLTRGLHGGWPIKPYGSYLLELGSSWAIVMILTGLYLWWPRNAIGLAGALYPRVRAGSRTFWRDLHSIVGVYFALFVLAFLFTALPWTSFWGERILLPIQQATGQTAPTDAFFGGADAHHARGAHQGHINAAPSRAVSLAPLVAKARTEGVKGAIEVWPLTGSDPVNMRARYARASTEVHVRFDRSSGELLGKVTWNDFPTLAKAVATGVDLHEGTFFGRANQIFNTLVAICLIWLAVTGFIGWYKRRPRGGPSAPPKREIRYPKAVLGVGAILCIVLPLLGLSVAMIAAFDGFLVRVLRSE